MSKETVVDVGQQLLVDLLKKAVQGVDAAVTFSQAQIPDVIHQLLVWNAVSSLGCQLLGLFFFLLCWFLIKFYNSSWERRASWTRFSDTSESTSSEWDFRFLPVVVLSGVGCFLLALNFDWLKIWLAPKLYLVQYAATLIK